MATSVGTLSLEVYTPVQSSPGPATDQGVLWGSLSRGGDVAI